MLRCYLFGDESAFGWISNIGQFKMQNYILEVEGLVTRFFTRQGVVHAVDDVSFCMPPATTVALVGESGSGKSVTGLSIMRLIPPPGRIVSGEIRFNGQNLLELDDDSMRRIRGREIAMIFQDPMTSLNPVFTVGHQIAEVLCTHEGLGKKQASERSIELLDLVRIGNPRRRAADYPHQLSGGMRQRVMIAMDLLARLKEEFKVSLLLITHDLGVVAEVADRVEVMYAGQIMEQAPVRDIFDRPAHPYTEGLLKSIPRLDRDGQAPARLATIDGAVPSLIDLEEGCRFANRCSYRIDQCSEGPIPLAEPSPGRLSRCIRSEVVGSLR
jgi:oligopeptide/dipeptide ABC transporter ATP-binding protein